MRPRHNLGTLPVLEDFGAGIAPAPPSEDATESHSIYQEVWSSLAASSCAGEVVQREGVLIMTAGCKWPIMNTAFLSRPVTTKADLQDRISSAKDYFGQQERLWVLIAFNEWIDSAIQPQQVLWENRVAHLQDCIGMQSKRLTTPTSSTPELDYRLVESDEERLEFSDINADSYGFSAEWRTDISKWISQWPRSRVRLYVAYAGSEAVSSAMVHLVGDVAFLGFVATRPAHQKKKYGEAIARYALARAKQHWQITKSVLHSTPAGLPLYRSLGYSEVTSFGIYLGGCE